MTFSRVYDRLKGVKSLVTPFLILVSSFAFANARLDGISGVSRFVINPQDGSWIAYGGIQGDNFNTYGCPNNSTCNTCIGPAAANLNAIDGACNPAGVFANTMITFAATPTGTIAVGARWLLCNGAQEFIPGSINVLTPLTTTWGDICNAATAGNSDCSTAVSTTTLFFGTRRLDQKLDERAGISQVRTGPCMAQNALQGRLLFA